MQVEMTPTEARVAFAALMMMSKMGPAALENPEVLDRAKQSGGTAMLSIFVMASMSGLARDLAVKIRKTEDPTWSLESEEPEAVEPVKAEAPYTPSAALPEGTFEVPGTKTKN